MNICRFVWDFPRAHKITYGLGPNFYYLSKEQAKLGLDVNVVSSRRAGDPIYEEVEGIKLHRVEKPFNINSLRKLIELNRKSSVDLVHAHGTCGLSYPFIRRKFAKPLVVHVHGTSLGIKRNIEYLHPKISLKQFAMSMVREKIAVLRQKFFWRRADLLIAVSATLKEELESLYNVKGERIEVVHNGVDTLLFKPVVDTQRLKQKFGLENKRVVLYVGSYRPLKGISYLLRAMPRILEHVPNAFLLCVGGSPKWLGSNLYWKSLQERANRLKLREHVRLISEIPHHQLPHYYSLSDTFVLPSLYESFPKVILEAMACEKPVVASRVGGIPEIVKDNVNGVLIEPKNVEQLVGAIVRVLLDEKLATRLGKEAKKTVRSEFTWRHVAERVVATYDKLLEL